MADVENDRPRATAMQHEPVRLEEGSGARRVARREEPRCFAYLATAAVKTFPCMPLYRRHK